MITLVACQKTRPLSDWSCHPTGGYARLTSTAPCGTEFSALASCVFAR